MNIQLFQAMLEPVGQKAIAAAVDFEPREEDFLSHFTALSRRFPPDLARAALETAILRSEAAIKFPHADKLYFTREALEQASSWEVSTYRAQRFRPFSYLADLGCSVGGDTLVLASIAPTIGIDHDSLRLAMAHANLQALGLEGRTQLIQADLAMALPLSPIPYPLPPGIALFFDPARREDGRRIYSVDRYHPPLAIIKNWRTGFPAIGAKISPGVDLEEVTSFDAEIEFISLRGELKEAVLWFGLLKSADRRATVLPGPYTLTGDGPFPLPGMDNTYRNTSPLSPPLAYLYEPDPAILRAGLVTDLGAQIGAAQLDAVIAYLTSGEMRHTPFARVWKVEDWFPFGLKRLRAYLRQRGVGRVVVKKRGSPLEPEALIRDLRLRGEQERVVFLTQMRGRPIVVVCLP